VLLRSDPDDPDGVIAITQPCHGWVAGQLARAWGGALAGEFAPREEVCLAAEQHDLAWANWDQAPTLNPETGRPHSFATVPLVERLAFWPAAPARLLLPQSRYAAVLVSLHSTRLHAGFDPEQEAPAVGAALRRLRDDEASFREAVVATLQGDQRYAAHASPEALARNYALLSTWDRLSLFICHGVRETRVLDGVPAAAGEVRLSIIPAGGSAGGAAASAAEVNQRLVVEPWPFATDAVTVVWEGRRLRGRFADEYSLRAALRQAPWVSGRVVLTPST
jgi:hypothetical protein